jgi:hypothetical protein
VPDIQRDVKYPAGHHINQFALGVFQLVMKPPNAAFAGVRVIVLDKRLADSFFSVSGLMIGFQKIAAVIFKHRRLHQDYFTKGCTVALQVHFLLSSLSIYSFTFGYARSKHALYFSIKPAIHQSITLSEPEASTPILPVRLTSCFDKERMTAVKQRR